MIHGVQAKTWTDTSSVKKNSVASYIIFASVDLYG